MASMSLCSRVVSPEQNRVTVPDPFEVKGSIGGNEGHCLDSVMSQPSVLHANGVAVWFLFAVTNNGGARKPRRRQGRKGKRRGMRSARTNSASFDHFTAELQRVSGNCSVPPQAACGPEFTLAGKVRRAPTRPAIAGSMCSLIRDVNAQES